MCFTLTSIEYESVSVSIQENSLVLVYVVPVVIKVFMLYFYSNSNFIKVLDRADLPVLVKTPLHYSCKHSVKSSIFLWLYQHQSINRFFNKRKEHWTPKGYAIVKHRMVGFWYGKTLQDRNLLRKHNAWRKTGMLNADKSIFLLCSEAYLVLFRAK